MGVTYRQANAQGGARCSLILGPTFRLERLPYLKTPLVQAVPQHPAYAVPAFHGPQHSLARWVGSLNKSSCRGGLVSGNKSGC
jgi:hypothetical protein